MPHTLYFEPYDRSLQPLLFASKAGDGGQLEHTDRGDRRGGGGWGGIEVSKGPGNIMHEYYDSMQSIFFEKSLKLFTGVTSLESMLDSPPVYCAWKPLHTHTHLKGANFRKSYKILSKSVVTPN